MDTYVLTQGTQSNSNLTIIKNNSILSIDDLERAEIVDVFRKFGDNDRFIENQSYSIFKRKDNFLISTISSNYDQYKRKVPIDILLIAYNEEDFNDFSFIDLNDILNIEKVKLTSLNKDSIILEIKDYELKRRRLKLRYIACLILVLILIIVAIYYV